MKGVHLLVMKHKPTLTLQVSSAADTEHNALESLDYNVKEWENRKGESSFAS